MMDGKFQESRGTNGLTFLHGPLAERKVLEFHHFPDSWNFSTLSPSFVYKYNIIYAAAVEFDPKPSEATFSTGFFSVASDQK